MMFVLPSRFLLRDERIASSVLASTAEIQKHFHSNRPPKKSNNCLAYRSIILSNIYKLIKIKNSYKKAPIIS